VIYSNIHLIKQIKIINMETTAFNSDTKVCEEILKLKNLFDIKCVIETGSYEGNTTKFLGENFEKVLSVEITDHFFQLSNQKCNHLKNVEIYKDSSEKFLSEILPKIENDYNFVMFYLDAHWENYWPLQDELIAISKSFKNRAIIVIDDFFVPNRNFQYDSYHNVKCDFSFIEKELNTCYDDNGYLYYYLNSTNRKLPIRDGSIGGVGKIYVLPKNSFEELDIKEDYLIKKENNINYSIL